MDALKFMHSLGIVHCDWSLRNVVLETNYGWTKIKSQETNLIIIGNIVALILQYIYLRWPALEIIYA